MNCKSHGQLLIATALIQALSFAACAPEKLSPSEYYNQPSDTVSTAVDSIEPPSTDIADALLDTAWPDDSSSDSVAPSDTADTETSADTDPQLDTADPADSTDVTANDTTAADLDACTPNCVNKECGDDGCGGICGICGAGAGCNDLNLCVSDCEKQCDGKFCGPDGCGGTCGSCEAGFECGADGKCYDVTCVPDCLGKVCGDDGCNGSCGDCVFGDLCDGGACIPGPCSGISEGTGDCDGDLLIQCVDGEKVVENCGAIPGYSCTWNPSLSQYQCLQTGSCIPNCVAKECGSDGCGGVCGVCPGGWPCQSSQCTPTEGGQCGYYNSVGSCEGQTLYYCDSGTLFIEDCEALDTFCGFDPMSQTNQCL